MEDLPPCKYCGEQPEVHGVELGMFALAFPDLRWNVECPCGMQALGRTEKIAREKWIERNTVAVDE